MNCGPGKVCKMMFGRPQCVCSPDCTNISIKHAVCGSDGKSYRDECALLMARCKGHPDLEVMYQGECKSEDTPVLQELSCMSAVWLFQILIVLLQQYYTHSWIQISIPL